jgi:hypothetical protein
MFFHENTAETFVDIFNANGGTVYINVTDKGIFMEMGLGVGDGITAFIKNL